MSSCVYLYGSFLNQQTCHHLLNLDNHNPNYMLYYFFSLVPTSAPHLFGWLFNGFKLSVSFKLWGIYPSDTQGILLGYIIKYTLIGEPNTTRMTVVSPNATSGTVSHLKEGSYHIAAAAFTKKGAGPYRSYNITCTLNYKLWITQSWSRILLP